MSVCLSASFQNIITSWKGKILVRFMAALRWALLFSCCFHRAECTLIFEQRQFVSDLCESFAPTPPPSTSSGHASTIPNANDGNGAGWNCSSIQDACTFSGLRCTNNSITSINLPKWSLSGTLPSSISALLDLETLQLYSNKLNGSIPQQIFGLPKLISVSLQSNSFSGALEFPVSNVSPLLYLDISKNALEGIIPETLAQFSQLTYLNLQSNHLSGDMPLSLRDLVALDFIFLDGNQLQGCACFAETRRPFSYCSLDSKNLCSFTNFTPCYEGSLSKLDCISPVFPSASLPSPSPIPVFPESINGVIPDTLSSGTGTVLPSPIQLIPLPSSTSTRPFNPIPTPYSSAPTNFPSSPTSPKFANGNCTGSLSLQRLSILMCDAHSGSWVPNITGLFEGDLTLSNISQLSLSTSQVVNVSGCVEMSNLSLVLDTNCSVASNAIIPLIHSLSNCTRVDSSTIHVYCGIETSNLNQSAPGSLESRIAAFCLIGAFRAGGYIVYVYSSAPNSSTTGDSHKTIAYAGTALGLVSCSLGIIIALTRRPSQNSAPNLKALPDQISWQFRNAEADLSKWQKSHDIPAFYKKKLRPSSSEYARVRDLFYGPLGACGELIIREAYAIYAPASITSFINYREKLSARYAADPRAFLSESWKSLPGADLRTWMKRKFEKCTSHYTWNIGTQVPILPVIHGTDANVAWKICKSGFAALSSLDAGWYGKGIYFSTNAQYILPYFAAKSVPAIIVSYAIPGNVFPVTERKDGNNSLLGSAIKAGYQSHWVLTAKDGHPCAHKYKQEKFFSELVLEQEAQVVPAYVLLIDPQSLPSLLHQFLRELPSANPVVLNNNNNNDLVPVTFQNIPSSNANKNSLYDRDGDEQEEEEEEETISISLSLFDFKDRNSSREEVEVKKNTLSLSNINDLFMQPLLEEEIP